MERKPPRMFLNRRVFFLRTKALGRAIIVASHDWKRHGITAEGPHPDMNGYRDWLAGKIREARAHYQSKVS